MCNLGNINLNHYIHSSNQLGKRSLLLDKLADDTWHALVLLDRVRARLLYPFEWMRVTSEANARLGLGVMGFADLCTRL